MKVIFKHIDSMLATRRHLAEFDGTEKPYEIGDEEEGVVVVE